MNMPVFDLHCDSAFALMGNDFQRSTSLRKNQLHIDLERAALLGGYAQCFACFTAPGILERYASPVRLFEMELATIVREVEKNKDLIRQAYSADEIEANRAAGIMSAVLTIEGPAGFDFDPALLEDLYKVGFRMSTLGWNENNVLAGSHMTGGGLTDLGREYVLEAQRLGMIVDVSHISDEAFWDIMDITTAPIVASHSNSRSVWNCTRNISDEMFLQICKTGGVAGMNMFTEFLGTAPDLTTVCDHILHLLELDPTGRHIALGGDLDGCSSLPAGFEGIQDYAKLAQALRERGIDDHMIRDIFWNNAIGVFQTCCI